MSNPALSYEIDDCQFEHILGQLEQQWSLREQVATVLKEASATFASQVTQPSAYRYMEACDDLAKFLNYKIPLEYHEQKLLVQVLQIACAMHENAINNLTLTPAERSTHYLATTSFVPLCESALEGCVTHTEFWCEIFSLSHRAEKVLDEATDALDLSKCLDFGNMTDGCSNEDGNDASQTSAAPSPAPTTSKLATPGNDIAVDAPRSTTIKDKALAILNDQPSTGKGAPLGRAHTMPSLSQTSSSSYSSQTSAGRKPSKAHSRVHALQRIEE